MIRVSVFWPNAEGGTFDVDYYAKKHVPMVLGLLGDAVQQGAVDSGVGGYEPGSSAPFAAAGHLVFESVDAFRTAWEPNAQAILGDVPTHESLAVCPGQRDRPLASPLTAVVVDGRLRFA